MGEERADRERGGVDGGVDRLALLVREPRGRRRRRMRLLLGAWRALERRLRRLGPEGEISHRRRSGVRRAMHVSGRECSSLAPIQNELKISVLRIYEEDRLGMV